MKVILKYERDKEGVTYDLCICRWNDYYLRICHEARLKKCHTLISIFHFSQGVRMLLGFFIDNSLR